MDGWEREMGDEKKPAATKYPLSNNCLTNAVEILDGPRSVGNRKPISWIPAAQCLSSASDIHFIFRVVNFSPLIVPHVLLLFLITNHRRYMLATAVGWLISTSERQNISYHWATAFWKMSVILWVIDFTDGNMKKKKKSRSPFVWAENEQFWTWKDGRKETLKRIVCCPLLSASGRKRNLPENIHFSHMCWKRRSGNMGNEGF